MYLNYFDRESGCISVMASATEEGGALSDIKMSIPREIRTRFEETGNPEVFIINR